MIFFECLWKQDSLDDPNMILSVLDKKRNELSKYEFYSDGTYGFCNQEISAGGTNLSLNPYPPTDHINADKQFQAREVSYSDYSTILFKSILNSRLR